MKDRPSLASTFLMEKMHSWSRENTKLFQFWVPFVFTARTTGGFIRLAVVPLVCRAVPVAWQIGEPTSSSHQSFPSATCDAWRKCESGLEARAYDSRLFQQVEELGYVVRPVQGFNHFDGERKNNETHFFSIHSAELELLYCFFSNTLASSWISWIPLQLYGRLFCFRANRFISGFYPVCIMMRLLPGETLGILLEGWWHSKSTTEVQSLCCPASASNCD